MEKKSDAEKLLQMFDDMEILRQAIDIQITKEEFEELMSEKFAQYDKDVQEKIAREAFNEMLANKKARILEILEVIKRIEGATQ